jgi:hypothetical protein
MSKLAATLIQGAINLCQQKPNPSRETISLNINADLGVYSVQCRVTFSIGANVKICGTLFI